MIQYLLSLLLNICNTCMLYSSKEPAYSHCSCATIIALIFKSTDESMAHLPVQK